MKIVAFGTLKGGTGKTTVAYNIGGILAEKSKVLFIDVDPQSNLSDNAGIDTADQHGYTVRDIFDNPNGTTAASVITKAPMEALPNLDIIASHIRLTATELRLVSTAAREQILKRWIQRNMDVLQQYDYILLDTNPSMGLINQNAFLCADSIVLVSDVSNKAKVGAELFMYLWGEICEAMQREDNVKALVINNADKRTKLSRELRDAYHDDVDFGKIIIDHVIPSRVQIKDTETEYVPVNILAPKSDSCAAFRALVEELREREVL